MNLGHKLGCYFLRAAHLVQDSWQIFASDLSFFQVRS
jgi:hypothetical protein